MQAGEMNLTSPTGQAVQEGLSWSSLADLGQLQAHEFPGLVAGAHLEGVAARAHGASHTAGHRGILAQRHLLWEAARQLRLLQPKCGRRIAHCPIRHPHRGAPALGWRALGPAGL